MQHSKLAIRAEWDAAAGVWVATSADIAGLAIEAASFDALLERLPGVLQDLIEANGLTLSGDAARFQSSILPSTTISSRGTPPTRP